MPNTPQITLEYLVDCLDGNEYGDATLFATLFRDRFVFDTSTEKWMCFGGNFWEEDHDDQSRAAVHVDCAEQYKRLYDDLKAKQQDVTDGKLSLNEAEKTALAERIKKASRRIDRMRSVRGAENTLRVARSLRSDHGPLVAHGEAWDTQPMLLPLSNGVLDLEAGSLLPGVPGDYLRRHCGCEYQSSATAPVFERFINEILCEDAEKIDFFQRALGYSLTGLTTEQYLFCLTGAGANGKNVLMETLHAVYGEFFWSAETELFLEQKYNKPSGSANADVASLHGRRLVSMSEAPPHRRIDVARVKKFTGSDTLTARSPHDKYEINFQPTAKFFMSFNDRPRGLAVDFAMRRRLIYIDFPLRFVEDVESEQQRDPQNAQFYRKRDPALKEKILSELPGVLNWLLDGCLKFQKYGLSPPASIQENVQNIIRDEDQLGRYLNECCERRDGARMKFKLFYDALAEWWDEEVGDRARISKRGISNELKKRGFIVESRGGVSWIYGLEIVVHVDRHDEP